MAAMTRRGPTVAVATREVRGGSPELRLRARTLGKCASEVLRERDRLEPVAGVRHEQHVGAVLGGRGAAERVPRGLQQRPALLQVAVSLPLGGGVDGVEGRTGRRVDAVRAGEYVALRVWVARLATLDAGKVGLERHLFQRVTVSARHRELDRCAVQLAVLALLSQGAWPVALVGDPVEVTVVEQAALQRD